jgi:eukaryotic-like serine/threonine-protein kinase
MPVTRADIEATLGPCDEAARVGSPSGSAECWRVVLGDDVMACKVVVKASEPERFQREVTALERIHSPRVVRVRGHGELTTADDGQRHPYLLSDFLEGGDVRANLTANGPPGDAQLRDFLAATVEGVEQLHAAGIVHRDLKPENIVLLGADWTKPVIIDLGLSRLVDLSSVTVYPWAGGTWPYMAPEQLRAERAIDRTDLWALAVVAGELGTGQHPFWHGEASLPLDWDGRLQAGIAVPGSRPAGLRDWVTEAGQYAAYRRPSAARARELLEAVWP